MSRPENEPEGELLHVDGTCPECGAPFRTGIWDHSVSCEFCGSLLVSARELDQEVFVAGARGDVPLDVAELIATREARDYMSTLVSRFRAEDGVELDVHSWVEPKVREFRARVLSELVVRESIDFFVPYEIHEQTVAQGILGRRSAVKETFIQGFDVEDISRLYDASRYNLRDRGLKLHGFYLQLISDVHLDHAQNRFLEICEEQPATAGPRRDASKVKLDKGTKTISMLDGTVRDRRLRVYKHMTYACVERAPRVVHYLIDRQFGTVAGELRQAEVETFRQIPPVDTASVLTRPEIRAIASECPNCGWELELPHRELIVFCPTCALGIRVTPKGLETQAYRVAAPPPPEEAESVLYFPFWAFEFRLRAGGFEYGRIWDWLEQVGPQAVAAQFRQNDPEQSLLFVPARNLYGTAELDDAFAQLAGWANWCQPTLSRERPLPDKRAKMLGVDLDAREATELVRFTLLAMHDVQSTRRLNGMNFKQLIADAELEAGTPFLAALPLPINERHWSPTLHAPSDQPEAYRLVGSTIRGVARAFLEDDFSSWRKPKRFALF